MHLKRTVGDFENLNGCYEQEMEIEVKGESRALILHLIITTRGNPRKPLGRQDRMGKDIKETPSFTNHESFSH
jgi:hypothetical protein